MVGAAEESPCSVEEAACVVVSVVTKMGAVVGGHIPLYASTSHSSLQSA